MIRFTCPSCKMVLQVQPNQGGIVIACPKCKNQMKVPSAQPVSAPATKPMPPQPTPVGTGDDPTPSVPPQENLILIGASLLFCFPVGLILVWQHPRWSKNQKWAWTGAWILFFALIGSLSEKPRDRSG